MEGGETEHSRAAGSEYLTHEIPGALYITSLDTLEIHMFFVFLEQLYDCNMQPAFSLISSPFGVRPKELIQLRLLRSQFALYARESGQSSRNLAPNSIGHLLRPL